MHTFAPTGVHTRTSTSTIKPLKRARAPARQRGQAAQERTYKKTHRHSKSPVKLRRLGVPYRPRLASLAPRAKIE
eukprot:6214795-Pleurochrysis_carterae.AAC.1